MKKYEEYYKILAESRAAYDVYILNKEYYEQLWEGHLLHQEQIIKEMGRDKGKYRKLNISKLDDLVPESHFKYTLQDFIKGDIINSVLKTLG